MIVDFNEYKNSKERSLLDLRAGAVVLQKLLNELNINKSSELSYIKKEISNTIKGISDKINESSKRKTI